MNRFNNLFRYAVLLLASVSIQAAEPDWSNYDTLLKKNLIKTTREGVSLMAINYTAIKKDREFKKIVNQLARFNTKELKNKNEKLAFYMNAYNILAIKMVVDHWPVESIKDAGSLFSSVWQKEIGKIDNMPVTLHQVEHEILRLMNEPRIHMAVVCASISCPDLRDEPYTSTKLEAQLEDQTKIFLNNPQKGLVVRGNNVHVSRIFDWFEDDFETVGGLKRFFAKYRKDLPRKYKIKADLSYNWNLNKQ